MVFGRRRRRSNYPLNIRHHGYCVRELSQAQRLRSYVGFLMGMYNQRPSARLRNLIIICFIGVRIVTGNRIATNPTFIRINRFLVDFSDSQLYHIRITNRNHIPRLIAALHIPEIVECENGNVMQGQEAFLLLLYWFSFPRCLSIAQEIYGLEYSQISRIIKAMIILIMTEWRHLVDDNFAFYVPRFALYSQVITAKYLELHGAMDLKYARTALMTDGTQRQHNRDRRTNYSGHKGFYCYGYLVTAVPDGMIADVTGAFAGRKNDHMKQNEGRLSQRLVECQVDNHGVPNAIQYDTNCDKGSQIKILFLTYYSMFYLLFLNIYRLPSTAVR